MGEYKSNSHRSKEIEREEKKVERVVKGQVKSKKKNKFADTFISEDAASVKEYIIFDVLIPAAKNAISDMVTTGIQMMLYGEVRGGSKSKGSKVSYSKYYDDRRERDYDRRSRTRSGYDYDEIILESRAEAEEVLNSMDDLLERYGLVSVADLYDLVGVTGNYTDNKYGWTNLRHASVQRLRDGYLLKLPRAIPLD